MLEGPSKWGIRVKLISAENLLYAAIFTLSFAVSLYFLLPVWFPFLALALYFAYRSFKGARPIRNARGNSFVPPEFGVLGIYNVDGDPNDSSYGLYITLLGKPVFVDIREDGELESRKVRAQNLYANEPELEANLRKFIASNSEFENRTLKSIGLHSSNLNEGEVFWEPDGHSLLSGLEFLKSR